MLLLRVAWLLALTIGLAEAGNPWKHKGERADDYNGKQPVELERNKAFFANREAARKQHLRGAHEKSDRHTIHKKDRRKGAKRSILRSSERNHAHHHEHR